MTLRRAIFSLTLLAGNALIAGLAVAQAQPPAADAPLTDRERMLLDRVQKLEERLAILEAKSPEAAAPKPEPAAPKPAPAVAAAAPKPLPSSAALAAAEAPVQDSSNSALAASNGSPAVFGEFNPGRGFSVAKGEYGSLSLSGYMAVRYLNQLPADQTATDHLGRPIPVKPRQDFQFHRVMLFQQGWLFSPKFTYQTFVWTVQDTNQVAVGGALAYSFNKYFTFGGGWNAYPGTLSLQGSHPYWLSYDRVMADEFFRPFFSQGIFAQGLLAPRLEYRVMLGNNNSNLGVAAAKIDRKLSSGGAITWLPTTGEFGPRGAFGDYEGHEKLATRFNAAYSYGPEERQNDPSSVTNNTTIRLADSLNVFDPGTFGKGINVERTIFKLLSVGAGMKYKGFFLQAEGYHRRLDNFITSAGKMPVRNVQDTGFYVQMSHMVVPKKVELYAATSYVFSDYGRPKEFIFGGNWYPWNTRNLRTNVQLINVDHSPVNSTFGFYLGQLTGQVVAIGFTALY